MHLQFMHLQGYESIPSQPNYRRQDNDNMIDQSSLADKCKNPRGENDNITQIPDCNDRPPEDNNQPFLLNNMEEHYREMDEISNILKTPETDVYATLNIDSDCILL